MSLKSSRRQFASRAALVAELRERLLDKAFPRLQIVLILAIAGLGAFAFSAASLGAGLESMGLRYPLAALAGYVIFIGLIRLWIAYQRRSWRPDLDLPDGLDLASDSGTATAQQAVFGGGGSGGGGATGDWDLAAARSGTPLRTLPNATDRAPRLDLDLDDLWLLVLVAVCIFSAAVVLVYVVYLAPILLAEVALDAAVVTTAYRRLRRRDARTWLESTVRRTWMPALVLIVLLMVTGTALERLVPEARSIGGVARALGR